MPFTPTTTLELGDAGTTAFNRYPPFKLTITQAPGSADIKGNKITLPVELNTNNPAYKLCTQAQADADSCPANSKFGGAAAKSPFLAEEVKGPVYLIQQTNTSLPGLLLDLHGRVHVKIQTKTTLVNNKPIQSLVLNSPQLPISEFRIGLNGGKNGVFLNRQDLCFKGNSTSKFNDVSGLIKDYGHNGKTTAETKLKAKVNGCGPGVSGKISSATELAAERAAERRQAPRRAELQGADGDAQRQPVAREEPRRQRRERECRRRGVRQQAVLQGDRAPCRGRERRHDPPAAAAR